MKNLLTFSQKADRFEWWTVTLLTSLLMQISGFLGFVIMTTSRNSLYQTGGALLVILALLLLWISIAVTFRRLRDRGRPMWSILFYLLPMIGWIWMIIECGFLPSTYTGPKRTLVRKTVQREQNQQIDSATSLSTNPNIHRHP